MHASAPAQPIMQPANHQEFLLAVCRSNRCNSHLYCGGPIEQVKLSHAALNRSNHLRTAAGRVIFCCLTARVPEMRDIPPSLSQLVRRLATGCTHQSLRLPKWFSTSKSPVPIITIKHCNLTLRLFTYRHTQKGCLPLVYFQPDSIYT